MSAQLERLNFSQFSIRLYNSLDSIDIGYLSGSQTEAHIVKNALFFYEKTFRLESGGKIFW